MKKRLPLLLIAVLLSCLLGAFIWWQLPVTLLDGVDNGEVARIEVSSGSSGESFVIEDAQTVAAVVTNLQAAKLRKTEIAKIDGFSYSLALYDSDGALLEALVLNGEYDVRIGDVSLESDTPLCIALLRELEK